MYTQGYPKTSSFSLKRFFTRSLLNFHHQTDIVCTIDQLKVVTFLPSLGGFFFHPSAAKVTIKYCNITCRDRLIQDIYDSLQLRIEYTYLRERCPQCLFNVCLQLNIFLKPDLSITLFSIYNLHTALKTFMCQRCVRIYTHEKQWVGNKCKLKFLFDLTRKNIRSEE